MTVTKPDPETADRAAIAEWCGVRNPQTVPDGRVPVDSFRENGIVVCEQTGEQPDPPWVIVANYELPDGDDALLTHTAYADVLANRYGLDRGPARAYALREAGWTARDIRQDYHGERWNVNKAGEHIATAVDVIE